MRSAIVIRGNVGVNPILIGNIEDVFGKILQEADGLCG
jgi:hypothetical protein